FYNDVAWQFEAYKNGGLTNLETIAAIPANQDQLDIDAWRKIDQGIQDNDADLIQEGNIQIARWEQNVVLAQGYVDLGNLPGITPLMSVFAQNPIFGGPDFFSLEPFGDIADFIDRWDWVSRSYSSISDTGVIPLWFHETAASRMNDVQMPMLYRAQLFSYVYRWTSLTIY